MRVVVTGGAGFIGSSLCRRLLQDGHDVYSLDLEFSTVPNVQSFIGDITDPDLGEMNFWKDMDVCYHLAAMANVDEVRVLRRLAFDVNVFGTFNIVNICQQNDILIVFASTACVYGNTTQHPSTEDGPTHPVDLYGVTKLAGEEFVKLLPKWVILRFGTTLGQEMRPALATYIFLKQAYDNKPLTITGDGKQSRNWIHVDDLTRGCVLVLRHGIKNEIINLVGEKSYTVNRMAKFAVGVVRGVGARYTAKYIPAREGDVMKEDISIDKAEKLLGWVPRTNLRGGLILCFDTLKEKWNKGGQ